jgi:hypothetical protein
MTMSDMAYNNNAVHLTIDAYISKNIEKEHKNKIESYDENDSNSNRDSNSANKNDDRNKDEDENDDNRVDSISNSIYSNSNSNSDSDSEKEEEEEEDDILSFSDQRKSSYNNWNAAPHTPYEQVS